MRTLLALLGLNKGAIRLENGDRITVAPLGFRQHVIITKAFAPVADIIVERGADMMTIYESAADELITTVATAINKPFEYVENMQMTDFNKIFDRLMKVEENFFNGLILTAKVRSLETKQKK